MSGRDNTEAKMKKACIIFIIVVISSPGFGWWFDPGSLLGYSYKEFMLLNHKPTHSSEYKDTRMLIYENSQYLGVNNYAIYMFWEDSLISIDFIFYNINVTSLLNQLYPYYKQLIEKNVNSNLYIDKANDILVLSISSSKLYERYKDEIDLQE